MSVFDQDPFDELPAVVPWDEEVGVRQNVFNLLEFLRGQIDNRMEHLAQFCNEDHVRWTQEQFDRLLEALVVTTGRDIEEDV